MSTRRERETEKMGSIFSVLSSFVFGFLTYADAHTYQQTAPCFLTTEKDDDDNGKSERTDNKMTVSKKREKKK